MKSNKNLLIILIIFVALALVFFAYIRMAKTPPVPTNNQTTKNNPVINVSNNDISPDEPNMQEDSNPLTQGNSLDDIQQDLNSTNIVEEDLTDLK